MSVAIPKIDETLVARLRPWPENFLRSLGFVLLLSISYVLLALTLQWFGVFDLLTDTPNRDLLRETLSVLEPDSPFELFVYYPPLTYGIFGLLALTDKPLLYGALLGGLAAIILLLEVFELLKQKSFGVTQRFLTGAVLFLTPVLWYNALFNLQELMVTAFVGVGIAHMIRFVQWGSTYSGFISGMLFAGAAACGFTALLLLAVAVISIVALTRVYREYSGALPGTFLILLFPSALLLVTLSAVSYVVHGSMLELWRFPTNDLLLGGSLTEPGEPLWGAQWFDFFATVLPLSILFMLAKSTKVFAWAIWTLALALFSGLWYGWYTDNPFPLGGVFLFSSIVALVLLPDLKGEAKLPRRVVVALVFQFCVGWLIAVGYAPTNW